MRFKIMFKSYNGVLRGATQAAVPRKLGIP
jgi:hypothetical protein